VTRYMYGLEYTQLTCATCSRDVNADEEDMTRLDDDWQCRECLQMCPGCMEHITDITIKTYGVVVNWRDYIFDGKRVTMHCDCAATTFLTYLDPHYDLDHTTREEIAAMVESHTAKAVAS
jgi:hypothetical protein